MERYTCVASPDIIEAEVNVLAFSPDGQYLGVGTDDGLVSIYDHKAQHLTYQCVGRSPITALHWHPAERYAIFVGAGDGTCSVYRFSVENLVSRLWVNFFPLFSQHAYVG